MKTIKPIIYENLTPRQRIIAFIGAQAREDKNEETRLVKTCPQFNYTMNDHRFCEKLKAIQHLALVVEHDLRSCILDFLGDGLFYEIREFRDFEDLVRGIREWPESAQEMLNIKKAWHGFLEEEGLDPRAVDHIYADFEHSLTTRFITIAVKLGVSPDEHVVEKYKDFLRRYYDVV